MTSTPSDSIIGGAGATPASAPPLSANDGVADQTAAAAAPTDSNAPPTPDPSTTESVLTWDALSLPEGITVDEPTQASFLEIFNDANLSPQERASKLLSLHANMMESVATEMTEEWERVQAEWRGQVLAMPEFMNVEPEANYAEIARVVNRYGGAEARKAFNETGAGNHPAIVRMILKIAKDINEEPPVSGGPVVGETPSRADRLYGNQGG